MFSSKMYDVLPSIHALHPMSWQYPGKRVPDTQSISMSEGKSVHHVHGQ